MKRVRSVLRHCLMKERGGYGFPMVSFDACLNCPDCVFGVHDHLGTYELWCRHAAKEKFFVMVVQE